MILDKFEWDNLKHAICTDKKPTRLELTGLYINVQSRQVVTTNGAKLAIVTIEEDKELEFTSNCLIKMPNLSLKKDEKVQIAKVGDQVLLHHINRYGISVATLLCTEIDLNYVDYQRIIPNPNANMSGQGLTNLILNPENLPLTRSVEFIMSESYLFPVLCKCGKTRLTWVFMPMRRA